MPGAGSAMNDARNVRRPQTTSYATIRSRCAISTAIGRCSLPPNRDGLTTLPVLDCTSADPPLRRCLSRPTL